MSLSPELQSIMSRRRLLQAGDDDSKEEGEGISQTMEVDELIGRRIDAANAGTGDSSSSQKQRQHPWKKNQSKQQQQEQELQYVQPSTISTSALDLTLTPQSGNNINVFESSPSSLYSSTSMYRTTAPTSRMVSNSPLKQRQQQSIIPLVMTPAKSGNANKKQPPSLPGSGLGVSPASSSRSLKNKNEIRQQQEPKGPPLSQLSTQKSLQKFEYVPTTLSTGEDNSKSSLTPPACHACGLEAEFVQDGMIKCQKCNKVEYCSLECLHWDWSRGEHKNSCEGSSYMGSVDTNSHNEELNEKNTIVAQPLLKQSTKEGKKKSSSDLMQQDGAGIEIFSPEAEIPQQLEISPDVTPNNLAASNTITTEDASFNKEAFGFERGLFEVPKDITTVSNTTTKPFDSPTNYNLNSEPPSPLSNACNVCGIEAEFVPDGMTACNKCKIYVYCSTECLEWDWECGNHKGICEQLNKQRLNNNASKIASPSHDYSYETLYSHTQEKNGVDGANNFIAVVKNNDMSLSTNSADSKIGERSYAALSLGELSQIRIDSANNNRDLSSSKRSSNSSVIVEVNYQSNSCRACGIEDEFVADGMKSCSKCNRVKYCSTDCLQWDWINGDHKQTCEGEERTVRNTSHKKDLSINSAAGGSVSSHGAREQSELSKGDSNSVYSNNSYSKCDNDIYNESVGNDINTIPQHGWQQKQIQNQEISLNSIIQLPSIDEAPMPEKSPPTHLSSMQQQRQQQEKKEDAHFFGGALQVAKNTILGVISPSASTEDDLLSKEQLKVQESSKLSTSALLSQSFDEDGNDPSSDTLVSRSKPALERPSSTSSWLPHIFEGMLPSSTAEIFVSDGIEVANDRNLISNPEVHRQQPKRILQTKEDSIFDQSSVEAKSASSTSSSDRLVDSEGGISATVRKLNSSESGENRSIKLELLEQSIPFTGDEKEGQIVIANSSSSSTPALIPKEEVLSHTSYGIEAEYITDEKMINDREDEFHDTVTSPLQIDDRSKSKQMSLMLSSTTPEQRELKLEGFNKIKCIDSFDVVDRKKVELFASHNYDTESTFQTEKLPYHSNGDIYSSPRIMISNIENHPLDHNNALLAGNTEQISPWRRNNGSRPKPEEPTSRFQKYRQCLSEVSDVDNARVERKARETSEYDGNHSVSSNSVENTGRKDARRHLSFDEATDDDCSDNSSNCGDFTENLSSYISQSAIGAIMPEEPLPKLSLSDNTTDVARHEHSNASPSKGVKIVRFGDEDKERAIKAISKKNVSSPESPNNEKIKNGSVGIENYDDIEAGGSFRRVDNKRANMDKEKKNTQVDKTKYSCFWFKCIILFPLPILIGVGGFLAAKYLLIVPMVTHTLGLFRDNDVSDSDIAPITNTSLPSIDLAKTLNSVNDNPSAVTTLPSTLSSDEIAFLADSIPSISTQTNFIRTPTATPKVSEQTTERPTKNVDAATQFPTEKNNNLLWPTTTNPTKLVAKATEESIMWVSLPDFESPTSMPTILNNPKSTPSIFRNDLLSFLISISFDEGAALRSFDSPQNAGYRWLINNSDLETYSDTRIIQRYALATFFYSTQGEYWQDNTSWLSNEIECNWFSSSKQNPVCDLDKFVNLELDFNNVQGKIPPEIGLLSNLLYVALRGGPDSMLSGALPSTIGLLKSMEEFSIKGNFLSGFIPTEFGELQNIRNLNLSDNYITGPLPSEFGNMQELRSFFVEDNFISGLIPSELGRSVRLIRLNLANNLFSGKLPTLIGSLRGLISLNIELNILSQLPSHIGLLKQLNVFSAYGNNIKGSLFTELGQLTALRTLSLNYNSFSGPMPSEIGLLQRLRLQGTLDLSYNRFSGLIPSEIGLLGLRALQLQNNLLSGALPTEFSLLTRLNYLRIESNNLSGYIPQEVCQVFFDTYPIFYSDCTEEIECDCCTYCCLDGAGCSCVHAGSDLEFLC